jgi:two-component system, NtrC family, response regulator AtoC
VAEIADLARLFLDRAAAQLDLAKAPSLSDEALALLERHAWPGNVRELRNVMERAVVLCGGKTIVPLHFPAGLLRPTAASKQTPLPPATPDRNADERRRILEALEACAHNQTYAAARLGISRQTLIAKIKAYGLPRPRKAKGE